MAYTHTTFAELKTALANRLGDAGSVYWVNGADLSVDSELGLYIVEAMHTWNLMTGYWRDTGLVPTTSGTGFYDISTLTNSGGAALLSYARTDLGQSAYIQYHLLEPATGSTWAGSEQFTLTDVADSLTRRRNQLLLETGAVLALTTVSVSPGDKFIDLPDTTLTVERMYWTGASGVTTPLTEIDISAQRNYSTSYLTTPDVPQTFSSAQAGPLRYEIAPPANEAGTMTVLLVQSGANLDCSGISLGIPDDMAWIVKWGALADMLGKEGPGQDLARSYFCERRFRLGIELAKLYPTVINGMINNVSLSPDSIFNLDQYNLTWLSSSGQPEFIATLRNYIALAPCPNGVYSITLDVVRKALTPTLDTDYVQIGREYIDILLDYAEHLAAFKCGGEEFRHTFRAADNFFAAALGYNQRLTASNPSLPELIRQSTRDDYTTPPQKDTANRPLKQRAYNSENSE